MRYLPIRATAALLFLVFLSTEALAATGSLAGRFVDEHGNPVNQTEIRLYFAGSEDEVLRVQIPGTGFRIEGMPADWFDLEVSRPGFVPLRVPGVEVGPDSPTDLGLLLLTRGKRLEGRAVEPHGAPVEGAEVWVVPSDFASNRVWKVFQEAGPAAVTDQGGRFVLEGLDPRKFLRLNVCRPGHHTGRVFMASLDQDLIQVELPRAARLSGRVVDPAGKPVPGAAVHAGLSGAESGHHFPSSSPCPQSARFVSARSDAEGRFTLEPLEEGLFEIGARAEDHAQTAPQLVDVKAGRDSAGLTFVLAPLKATAPAAPVAPAANTSPVAQEPAPEPRPDRPVVLSGRIIGVAPEDLPDVDIIASRPGWGEEFHSGFVDRHGIYRFLSLAPGEWEVIAVNLEDGHAAKAKIVIAPGDEKPVLDLVFSEEPQ